MRTHSGDLYNRACSAYFRTDSDGILDQPNSAASGEQELNGRLYVVLRGGGDGQVLACYRVRNDGMLRRLRRWPKALEL